MRNAYFRTDNTGQVHCRCHHAATMFPLHTRWLQNLLFLPNWVTSHKVEAIKYSTYLLLIFWLIFFHFKCICVCRFVEGFNTLGLLQEMRAHPDLFRSMFEEDVTPLKAKDLSALFQVSFSAPGTRAREKENRTICFWRDWLIDVEGTEPSI